MSGEPVPGTQGRLVLEVRGLRKRFGGVAAVDDLSFSLRAGVVTSLIGPNGAGKTTCFNLITGAIRADAGQVLLDGDDITGRRPAAAANLGITRTFQDIRVFGKMSVLANVMASFKGQLGESPIAVFLRPRAVHRQEAELRERAAAILARVGLDGRERVAAADLSYAEQKLLIVARALASDSKLWLLDEPASGLDQGAVHELAQLIRSLVTADRGVLVVEHNLQMVREISDHVLFLNVGRLVAEGTPDDVFASADLQRLYVGAEVER